MDLHGNRCASRRAATRFQADIAGGRIARLLERGAFTEARNSLDRTISEILNATNESGFEEFAHANEVPLGISEILTLETLNNLEQHEITTLGQLRRTSKYTLSKISGIGERRLAEIMQASEELAVKWRKAKKLKDARRRRERERLLREEEQQAKRN